MFVSLYETIEYAVKRKLEILRDYEKWFKEGHKKHLKYQGKKVKVSI